MEGVKREGGRRTRVTFPVRAHPLRRCRAGRSVRRAVDGVGLAGGSHVDARRSRSIVLAQEVALVVVRLGGRAEHVLVRDGTLERAEGRAGGGGGLGLPAGETVVRGSSGADGLVREVGGAGEEGEEGEEEGGGGEEHGGEVVTLSLLLTLATPLSLSLSAPSNNGIFNHQLKVGEGIDWQSVL